MYVFEDKGGRKLALRPEITAAVIRMYINEAKVAPKPLRWCYFADCFRYERPQKGRYRQFWQFGVELIGADTAIADAEIIILAAEQLNATGVTYDLKVGHLSFMKNLLKSLEPDAQRRVMAHLDKKDFAGLDLALSDMGKADLAESLTALIGCRTLPEAFGIAGTIPEKERIEQTIALLDAAGVRYSLNFGIARGLDYYTGMVFEGFAQNLGTENQILGGGAYRLAHLFGGDDVASCGFAIGFERVMVSLGDIKHPKDIIVGIVCTAKAGRVRLKLRVHSAPKAYGPSWTSWNAVLAPSCPCIKNCGFCRRDRPARGRVWRYYAQEPAYSRTENG